MGVERMSTKHIVTVEVTVSGALDNSAAGSLVSDLLNRDLQVRGVEIVDCVEVDAHTGWPVGPGPLKQAKGKS